MIELDVQQTRDTRLIVFHDDQLERTTNGRGTVRAMRYAQLARMDAGRWFHPRFAGASILLLSQVFPLIPSHLLINLELKPVIHPRSFLTRVIRCIRHARRVRRVLLSSFEPALLMPFRALGWPRALICCEHPQRSLRHAAQLGCASWHPLHTLVTPQRVAQAHAEGLRVHAWTVDELPRARQLIRWGVDGLFTNNPATLAHHLRGVRR